MAEAGLEKDQVAQTEATNIINNVLNSQGGPEQPQYIIYTRKVYTEELFYRTTFFRRMHTLKREDPARWAHVDDDQIIKLTTMTELIPKSDDMADLLALDNCIFFVYDARLHHGVEVHWFYMDVSELMDLATHHEQMVSIAMSTGDGGMHSLCATHAILHVACTRLV